jgi:N-formylmaleamate deformylase
MGAIAEKGTLDMAHWFEGTVHANRIAIHYTRTGGGKPPVVLSHGLTDNGACWTRLAQALESDYDVIMPDARGHGQSEAPEYGYRTEERAADLIGLIEQLQLDRLVLIGHSMGGESSAMAVAQAPHLVRAVILEDPAFSSGQISDQNVGVEWAKRLKEEQAMTLEDLASYGRSTRSTWAPDTFEFWAQAKHEVNLKVFTWFDEPPRTPWQEFVKQIASPTLLITGEPARGAIITEAMAQEFVALCPQGKVTRILDAGHCVRYEQPDAYLASVTGFLREVT